MEFKIDKPKEIVKEDFFPKAMTYEVLLSQFGLMGRDVLVNINKPVRNGEYYQQGILSGFKCGIWGGGHSRFKNGVAMSYDSSKKHWIKKPKVHVTYNLYYWSNGNGKGGQQSDWIDVDNCTFEIIKT